MDDPADSIDIVKAYNACINSRSLDKLAVLMSENHVFIDTTGGRIEGKAACKEAWRDFFGQFPDYRNKFEKFEKHNDSVLVIGQSTCSFKPLDGPALWRVKTKDGEVVEWRIFDDTTRNRKLLGLS